MKATIADWWGYVKPETVEIEDLQAWIEEHGGAVMIRPPVVTKKDEWLIITTDSTNRFNQR